MKLTSDEDHALALLRRFPGAGALGGDGNAVASRLVRAATMSENLGGDTALLAVLTAAYPEEHAAALAAGLDATHVEAALWKAHEARVGQAERGVTRDDSVRRKNNATVARRRAQAKASRRANRRR